MAQKKYLDYDGLTTYHKALLAKLKTEQFDVLNEKINNLIALVDNPDQVNTAIDTFNEIVKFLEGVDPSGDALKDIIDHIGQLSSLNSALTKTNIVAAINSLYNKLYAVQAGSAVSVTAGSTTTGYPSTKKINVLAGNGLIIGTDSNNASTYNKVSINEGSGIQIEEEHLSLNLATNGGIEIKDTKNETTDKTFPVGIKLPTNSGLALGSTGLKINSSAPAGGSVKAFNVHIDNNTPRVALTKATSSSYGIVKLSSDTQQTVAPNAVTATASRTYAVQTDSNDKLVVNVPWANTTYSVMSRTANGLAPKAPEGTGTSKYLREDGTWVAPPNTTYSVATTTANGLMPATDKAKLTDILPELTTEDMVNYANVNTGLYKGAGATNYDFCIVYATSEHAGIMSVTDKVKLDGIASGANKYTLPVSTSSTLGGIKLLTSGTTSKNNGYGLIKDTGSNLFAVDLSDAIVAITNAEITNIINNL